MEVNINKRLKKLISSKRFKFIFGSRGSGKSFGAGDILLLMVVGFIPFGLNDNQLKRYDKNDFEYHFKPLTILCTREIQNSIKDSVHSLLSARIKELFKDDWDKLFDISNNEIKCSNGSRFIFKGLYRNVTSIQSIPNIDIVWIEEAQAVSKESLDILMPTIRNNKSELWFTFNPMYDNDPIIVLKDSIKQKDKIEIDINYQDNPFFPDSLKLQKDIDYERDPILAKHIWEGETLKQGSGFILSTDEVMKCINRDIKIYDNDPIEVGCDVARYGSDSTTIFKRKGLKLIDFIEIGYSSIIDTTDAIMKITDKESLIKVDDVGLGGGVTDLLADKGYNVIGINNGANAHDKEKYPNCISEQWFNFRDIIKKVSFGEFNIPRLVAELSHRKYGYDTKYRRVVESKKDYKIRAKSSPDYADGLLLCYYKVDTELKIRFV